VLVFVAKQLPNLVISVIVVAKSRNIRNCQSRNCGVRGRISDKAILVALFCWFINLIWRSMRPDFLEKRGAPTSTVFLAPLYFPICDRLSKDKEQEFHCEECCEARAWYDHASASTPHSKSCSSSQESQAKMAKSWGQTSGPEVGVPLERFQTKQ
jgi:hypothetical protein